jgi:hypothetical protein
VLLVAAGRKETMELLSKVVYRWANRKVN